MENLRSENPSWKHLQTTTKFSMARLFAIANSVGCRAGIAGICTLPLSHTLLCLCLGVRECVRACVRDVHDVCACVLCCLPLCRCSLVRGVHAHVLVLACRSLSRLRCNLLARHGSHPMHLSGYLCTGISAPVSLHRYLCTGISAPCICLGISAPALDVCALVCLCLYACVRSRSQTRQGGAHSGGRCACRHRIGVLACLCPRFHERRNRRHPAGKGCMLMLMCVCMRADQRTQRSRHVDKNLMSIFTRDGGHVRSLLQHETLSLSFPPSLPHFLLHTRMHTYTHNRPSNRKICRAQPRRKTLPIDFYRVCTWP
jgi:hypothetical protein